MENKHLVALVPKPYTVRPLTQEDFLRLYRLEQEIWGARGEDMLCPFYLRLCIEQFGDICFLALDGERPVGYVLNILRQSTVYCATLAVHPNYQRTRVTYLLVSAMVKRLDELDVNECWFTVSPNNHAAREVHASLGARVIGERHDYYGPGDTRLVSRIDREQIIRLRQRFRRAA